MRLTDKHMGGYFYVWQHIKNFHANEEWEREWWMQVEGARRSMGRGGGVLDTTGEGVRIVHADGKLQWPGWLLLRLHGLPDIVPTVGQVMYIIHLPSIRLNCCRKLLQWIWSQEAAIFSPSNRMYITYTQIISPYNTSVWGLHRLIPLPSQLQSFSPLLLASPKEVIISCLLLVASALVLPPCHCASQMSVRVDQSQQCTRLPHWLETATAHFQP